jgi:aspartate-semialdehyde dehydrogenase
VAFFAGREGAKGASVQWGPVATEKGAVVIDNGGDFRMFPDYPLVVPEVNMDAVDEALARGHKHLCSPNCSTIQMVVALAPLHRVARIKRIVVATYQAVSGWGGAAQELMRRQARNWVDGEDIEHDPSVFSRPIIADCLPHIDRFLPDGYTKEEMKMVHETRKIMGDHTIQVSPTTVRVPVDIGHAEAINVEFKDRLTADEARAILSDPKQSPGVILVDEPDPSPEAQGVRKDKHARRFPTNRDVEQPSYRDAVLVGRVRQDESVDSGLNLWVVSDNLRKGAALNVVQIAEQMIERGLLG